MPYETESNYIKYNFYYYLSISEAELYLMQNLF